MSSSWQDKIIVANQFVLSGIFLIWQGGSPHDCCPIIKAKGKFIYIAHFSNMASPSALHQLTNIKQTQSH